jgi:DNA topoisomerase IB
MARDKTPATATPSVAEAAAVAREAGLRYVLADEPGIRRVRHGNRFVYLDPLGRPLPPDEIARVRKLAIPPAYRDVWICADPRGHLQATGIDARGRKQYRYHADWRSQRDAMKFERMADFGKSLVRLRRRVQRDLALKGLPRDKVLAVVVSLLDSTHARVGNTQYARENGSFGLTTLRSRHVRFVCDGRALFQFRGKGGIDHEITLDDRRLARIVRRCQELPGQQLFQYIDDHGERHAVSSDQVNEYLREVMGTDFTAKDFRTWGATMHALALMARTPLPEARSEHAFKQCIAAAVKQVASELRNTPTVCRKAYINPLIFSAWRDGSLHEFFSNRGSSKQPKPERLLIAFLHAQSRAACKTSRRTAAQKPLRHTSNTPPA